ncbi:MAG: DUF4097 family beta strand repeat-containing protein [Eubacteriales bacterium]|nr:DUF4097 family beta strand repeat-containing protein [Eubacteriales bacterium]
MKTIRIIQLVILLLVIVILAAVLVVGLLGRLPVTFAGVFGNLASVDSVMVFDRQYNGSGLNKIDADLSTASIEFEFSQDDELRVVYYGPEKEINNPTIDIDYDEIQLNINQANRFGFFNNIINERVIVYLPADFSSEIICKTASGNIKMNDNMILNKLEMSVSSGNISMQDIDVLNLKINLSSGGISADEMLLEQYGIKVSSGNVKLNSLKGTGDIKTTSGSISIDSYEGSGLLKSTSGNVNLGLKMLTDDLDIELTSGGANIRILQSAPDFSCDFDVVSGSIRTNFGDVDDEIAGASFDYDFIDDANNKLRIKTTSGNLKVEHVSS